MKNLEKICIDVCGIATETGRYIIDEAQKITSGDILSKGTHDYVTHVDLESEKRLTEKLGKLIPEAVFIAEEGTVMKQEGNLCWVIDPLDGTTNYMHGLPPYSISIALTEGEHILVGVVHNISNGETFYAWKDGGARFDGRLIKVSGNSGLNNSLIATGFPYKNFERIDDYLRTLGFFMMNTHGIRRMGSAAIDLAYVACGRFDAFFEYNLNIWDVAAGILLVREAGGITSDFSGNRHIIDGSEIIASNDLLFEDFRAKVDKFMSK